MDVSELVMTSSTRGWAKGSSVRWGSHHRLELPTGATLEHRGMLG